MAADDTVQKEDKMKGQEGTDQADPYEAIARRIGPQIEALADRLEEDVVARVHGVISDDERAMRQVRLLMGLTPREGEYLKIVQGRRVLETSLEGMDLGVVAPYEVHAAIHTVYTVLNEEQRRELIRQMVLAMAERFGAAGLRDRVIEIGRMLCGDDHAKEMEAQYDAAVGGDSPTSN